MDQDQKICACVNINDGFCNDTEIIFQKKVSNTEQLTELVMVLIYSV